MQPYNYVLKNSAGAIIKSGAATAPLVMSGLAYQDPIGYTVEITDSSGEKVIIGNLIIGGLPILTASASKTDTTCFNEGNGSIAITIGGGKLPYTITTTGPNNFNSTNINIPDLNNGVYTSTITDSLNPPQTITLTTSINSVYPEMALTAAPANVLSKQCSTIFYSISVLLSYSFSTPSKVKLQYSNLSGKWIDVDSNVNNLWYAGSSTPITFKLHSSDFGSSIKIRVQFGNTNCFSNVLEIPTSAMPRPTTALAGSISSSYYSTTSPHIQHIVSASGGVGAINGNPYGIGSVYDNNIKITTTLYDSVGCAVTING